MVQLTIILNIFLWKIIITMKQTFNFLLIEKPKKRPYPYYNEVENNKLYGNIWRKKPKLNSIDELNQIDYIIKNLKINQESPEKYNYIEHKEQHTSFYSSIDVLYEENSFDNNAIIFEESNLKYILNNIENQYNNNSKIKTESAKFIKNKKEKKSKENTNNNKEIKKITKKVSISE